MAYFVLKAALSGILIALISEVARRFPSFGGLIASLPMISLLAIMWLWRDTGGDIAQTAAHARATLWYVIPSLPFFLILPALLERGLSFWLSLFAASLVTICLYLTSIFIAARLGMPFDQGT